MKLQLLMRLITIYCNYCKMKVSYEHYEITFTLETSKLFIQIRDNDTFEIYEREYYEEYFETANNLKLQNVYNLLELFFNKESNVDGDIKVLSDAVDINLKYFNPVMDISIKLHVDIKKTDENEKINNRLKHDITVLTQKVNNLELMLQKSSICIAQQNILSGSTNFDICLNIPHKLESLRINRVTNTFRYYNNILDVDGFTLFNSNFNIIDVETMTINNFPNVHLNVLPKKLKHLRLNNVNIITTTGVIPEIVKIVVVNCPQLKSLKNFTFPTSLKTIDMKNANCTELYGEIPILKERGIEIIC